MKYIPLTHGKTALVDDADFARVSAHSWHAVERRGVWSAQTGLYLPGRTQPRGVTLGRFLLDLPAGLQAIHLNGDALDNRRANLRAATHAEARRHDPRYRNHSTGYRGVQRSPSGYRARIQVDGRVLHLGTFGTAEQAARARDTAARAAWGEVAYLNFPERVA